MRQWKCQNSFKTRNRKQECKMNRDNLILNKRKISLIAFLTIGPNTAEWKEEFKERLEELIYSVTRRDETVVATAVTVVLAHSTLFFKAPARKWRIPLLVSEQFRSMFMKTKVAEPSTVGKPRLMSHRLIQLIISLNLVFQWSFKSSFRAFQRFCKMFFCFFFSI